MSLLIAGAGMAGAMDVLVKDHPSPAMRATLGQCLRQWDDARDLYRAAVGLPPLEKTS